MPRISYVNGRYLRHGDASVHIEDRGYQFADAVYEVVAIVAGRMIDEELHFARLQRSLNEIRMELPHSRGIFRLKIAELLRRNRLTDGNLYIQVSRGVAPRNHRIPDAVKPAVVMTVRPMSPPSQSVVEKGVSVVTVPDIRWKRPDIKSVALLPNILAKDHAEKEGVYEAWQVDESGMVTEGTSTNAWIVVGGKMITHPAAEAILNGVTRLALIEIAAAAGLTVEERPFSVPEAVEADEAFLTSTSTFLLPVVRINGGDVGDGKPGPLSRQLLDRYRVHLWGGNA